MSKHSFSKIDQKEYLKKYLAGDKVKNRKRDRNSKKLSKTARVRIIDDDINHLGSSLKIDEELLLTGEDAPQIVGEYIEEAPADTRVRKWKSFGIKDEPDDNDDIKEEVHNLWGRNSVKLRENKKYDFGRTNTKTVSRRSPPRRDEREYKPLSPLRHCVSPSARWNSKNSPLRYSTNEFLGKNTQIKTEPQSTQYANRERNAVQRRANERKYSFDSSPPRKRNSSLSPTRRHKNPFKNDYKEVSESPPPTLRNSNRSPLTKCESSSRYFESSSHHSPLGRRRDSDQSPPRRDKNREKSPPVRKTSLRHSPLAQPIGSIRNNRQQSRRRRDSDQSPPRRDKKHNQSPSHGRSSFYHMNSEKLRDTVKVSRNKSPFLSANLRRTHTEHSPSERVRNRHQSPPGRKTSFRHSPAEKCKSPLRNNRKLSPRLSPNRGIKDTYKSPPRRDTNRGPSPLRRRNNVHHSPSDIRNNRRNSPFFSPNHRRRYSEQSSPRRDRNRDQSPPGRKASFRHSLAEKCKSPVRNNRKLSPRLSPNRGIKDTYKSPPRRDTNRGPSPLRRRNNVHHSPSDIRNNRKNSPFLSPKRQRRDSDQSPPRKDRMGYSNNFSPDGLSRNSRNRHERETSNHRFHKKDRSSDQSPLRKIKSFDSPSNRRKREMHSRWRNQESPPPTHKPRPARTLEGKTAGLQDAKALHKESSERRKQENILFEKMSSDISGRNAEVQVRSTGRKGHRAKEAAEEDPEERRRKEVHEEKKKLLYERWGKGLKQIEDHKSRMLEQEYESNKPLARYSNDEDLERHLKQQERSEDPMLEYMRQKRQEQEKRSGKPQIPRYEGSYPENRFDIRPGYRWDGVDRSNGYEKKYFAVQNEKQARQDEAYKYSVEDM